MPRPKLTVSKKVKATATVVVKVQHEIMALDYFMLPRLQEGYNDRLGQDTDQNIWSMTEI